MHGNGLVGNVNVKDLLISMGTIDAIKNWYLKIEAEKGEVHGKPITRTPMETIR
jgi:hypothetical protein